MRIGIDRALVCATLTLVPLGGGGTARAPPSAGDGTAVTLDRLGVEGRGGPSVGYLGTRSATKTDTPPIDTPPIDTPQAVSVVTREQIQDQGFRGITEALRYMPGVFLHQGAANRDEVVIRGQTSSADFYVNGIRDDAMYFRDLYNVQRVEVLTGPNALIFGRGGGGGVVNRVLKEADGAPIREVLLQGGSFGTKRMTVDVGDRLSDMAFARLNGLFEGSGTFRDFVDLRRRGFNPTATLLLGPETSLKLAYEYFHDDRTADPRHPLAIRAARPLPRQHPHLLRQPGPELRAGRRAHRHGAARTQLRIRRRAPQPAPLRRYAKLYQVIYPSIRAGRAVNAAGTRVDLSAFDNDTPRTNIFSQNDVTYRFTTGPLDHTVLAGFELGNQSGLTYREDGIFGTTRSAVLTVNPLSPVARVPVGFLPSTPNNRYDLGLAAVYAQDQMGIGPHLQLIGGLRYDHFDFSSTDRRTNVSNTRIDDLLSPRVGVVLKPLDTLAFYGSFSASYLPSAGHQFTALSERLTIAAPERFENREVGVKWDAAPNLQLTGALYDLARYNQCLPGPNRAGFFLTSGQTNARGVEFGANGSVTEWWQVAGGYTFTDARIVNGFGSATIVPGNRVGLVPFNAITLWNEFTVTPDFSIGIGAIHQSHTYATAGNAVRLPGYARFDLGLFCQVNDLVRAQLDIENLFGRRYIATADSNNNISPGAPRLIRAQLIARF